MTSALLWKEYRQQRVVWLVIACLAILLVVSVAEFLGQGSGWQMFREEALRGALNGVIFSLTIAYGLVSGALLLAGDKDDGTMAFLDNLTGQRGALWTRKCLAGAVFTIAQSLALAGIAVLLGFASIDTVAFLPLAGLHALAWGLLAGAICSTVLTAVLTGIVLMSISWMLLVFQGYIGAVAVAEAATAIAAGYASRRIFCRDDDSRIPEKRRKPSKLFGKLPADWGTLLWLIWRQGRWVLAGCFAGALIVGFTIRLAPLIVWPFGTLLLGLACGLSVFAPDQNGRNLFLAAQRFPPGRIWSVKVIFWSAAAVFFTLLVWFVGAVLVRLIGMSLRSESDVSFAGLGHPIVWVYSWFGFYIGAGREIGNPIWLLAIWPLFGFCFGLLFGQITRRPAIAAILATVTALVVSVVWVPSLLVGGVVTWQILLIPLLLLLASRLAVRSWLAGRLLDAKPFYGLIGVGTFAVILLAGCLWYRVAEIPDLGEPFDVTAFSLSLPSSQDNKAGPMLRSAGLSMKSYREKIAKELGRPTSMFIDDDRPLSWHSYSAEEGYAKLQRHVLENGWPKDDKEVGHWLDLMFEGDWAKFAHKAAELPLGMIDDPRQANSDKPDTRKNDRQFYEMTELLCARALQLQARGDSLGALKELETALALSRQVRNYATNWQDQWHLEGVVFSTFQLWLDKTSTDKELLKAALAMWQKHEADMPDPVNQSKAAYLVSLKAEPRWLQGKTLAERLYTSRSVVPWEKERRSRVLNVAARYALKQMQKPRFGFPLETKSAESHFWAATDLGLPPSTGPGSSLSVGQWHQNLMPYWTTVGNFLAPRHVAVSSLDHVRATELLTALAIYRADHGTLPAKLDELVPAYLGKLPEDAYRGNPFGYRISAGEEIDTPMWRYGTEQQYRVAPGQGLIWTDRRPSEIYVVPLRNN